MLSGDVLATEVEIPIISSDAKSWYKDSINSRSDEFSHTKAYDKNNNTFYSVKDKYTIGNFLILRMREVNKINRVVLTNRLDKCCKDRIIDTAVHVRVMVGKTVQQTRDCGTDITSKNKYISFVHLFYL